MYAAHAAFDARAKITEETVTPVYWARQEWWASGQALRSDSQVSVRGRRVILPLLLPERTSLAKQFELPRTSAILRELRERGFDGPRVEILGHVSGRGGADACRSRPCLVLLAQAFDESSPVRCGRCLAPVPLYRLREDTHPERGRYWDALAWQEDFRRMDRMWLLDPASELNRDGHEVRERLEGVLRKRVYYFQWRSSLGGRPRSDLGKDESCPRCGRRWVIRGDRRGLAERFTRRCERCSTVGM